MNPRCVSFCGIPFSSAAISVKASVAGANAGLRRNHPAGSGVSHQARQPEKFENALRAKWFSQDREIVPLFFRFVDQLLSGNIS